MWEQVCGRTATWEGSLGSWTAGIFQGLKRDYQSNLLQHLKLDQSRNRESWLLNFQQRECRLFQLKEKGIAPILHPPVSLVTT